MSIIPFSIPFWAELVAAGLGGVQGAMFAAGFRDRRIDLLGVMVIGIVVSLGGSVMRDVLLNQPPVVIWNGWYIVVASSSALLGMALQPLLRRADRVVVLLDALIMGAFGAIATTKALSLGVGEVGAVMIGIIGAIGGSILRDVILNLPIAFLHVGSLFAVAAGAGSVVLVVLVTLGVPVAISGLVGVAVTALLRLIALRFNWTFPEQRPLRRPRSRRARLRRDA